MDKQAIKGICINGIGKMQFTFWRECIIELSGDPDHRLFYSKADATPEDDEFVAEFLDQCEILDLENASSESGELESILFTDTADNLSFIKNHSLPDEMACFFGGLGNFNHQEQADCAKSLKIERLITDVLPDELFNMTGSCPRYFVDKFKFLAPSTSSIEGRTGSHNEKILTLIVEEEGQAKDHSLKRIFNALSALEFFRCENLSEAKSDGFPEDMLLPGKNCHTVLFIGGDPLLHHVLSRICTQRGLRLIVLGASACLSPVRAILLDDENLIDWIDSIEPVQPLSLRQKFLKIIQDPPSASEEGGDAGDKASPLANTLPQALYGDEETGKFARISKAYANSFLASGSKGKSYVTHPVHFLENSLDVPKTISFSLSLMLTEGMPDITPEKVLKSLIFAAMRFACKLPYDFGKIHFLSKVSSINHELFISCLGKFSNSNNASTELTNFYAAMQSVILTSSMSEELRRKSIQALLEIQRHIEFSSRLFLSLNDVEAFHKLLSQTPPENLRDQASNAVYFALQNQPLDNNEKLAEYEKFCSDAIKSGHDGISTHRTLALLKILKGEGEGITEGLRNPAKPQLAFSQLPFVWHELALFSIFAGDDKEANELLESPKNKNGGPDLTNRLGAIALSLLLGKIEQADRFASEIDLEGTLETWSTKSIPYYIAYYHTIIFKYCGEQTSIKTAERMMDLSKIQLDEAFRPLIDRISSTSSPEEHLLKLANALANALPEIN